MAIKFDGIDAPRPPDEDVPWVPFAQCSDRVTAKLYAANAARGEVVLLLRAPPGIEFPPHRPTGLMTIYTLQGRWRYREHDWVAGPGSVVIEPAGVRHTPRVLPDGTDDAILLLVVNGDVQLLDADNRNVGVQSWRSAIDCYEEYCRANDLAPRDPKRDAR